jgi:hypothetical protein
VCVVKVRVCEAWSEASRCPLHVVCVVMGGSRGGEPQHGKHAPCSAFHVMVPAECPSKPLRSWCPASVFEWCCCSPGFAALCTLRGHLSPQTNQCCQHFGDQHNKRPHNTFIAGLSRGWVLLCMHVASHSMHVLHSRVKLLPCSKPHTLKLHSCTATTWHPSCICG